MISALEQYAALRRVEFDSPFQVGHSGTVYLHPERTIPPVPLACHDERADMVLDDVPYNVHTQWEALTGYTGQHAYNGPVMHASEYLGGRLADDILATPGIYVVTSVEGYPEDQEDGSEEPAGWTILRLKEN